jgi:acetyl esterase
MLDAADGLAEPSYETLGPAAARVIAERSLSALWGDKDAVAGVETYSLGSTGASFRARLYRTQNAKRVILFCHGGGWVVGNLETHDGIARALANAAHADLLSVEYRKAPEAPFPAGLDDAETALRWLLDRADGHGYPADRIILAGDSAGGTIAALLALRARQHGIRLAGQVLVYPATDLAGASASREAFGDGYFLDRARLDWYTRQFLAGGDNPGDPAVSPLKVDDLSRLPPALVVTADHDPLRDEGRAYAGHLIAAGNGVCYEEWRGTIHGFMIMDRTTTASRKLIARIGEWCDRTWQ